MTVVKKMNDGVAMLLERMKTNPEEFAGDSPTKWKNLVENYRPYLEANELKLLDDGIKELMRQRFTEKVMEEIIDPDDEYLDIPAQRIPRPKRFAGEITITSTSDTPIAGVTQTI